VARAAARVHVVVEDDGAGFDRAALGARSFGLSSIRERLSHLGGELRIESQVGRGTRIELIAPLDPSGASRTEGEEER
jgi:signal transduction histidine kinase